MESRRKVVAVLAIVGVALIVGGLAAVAIGSGSSDGGPSLSFGPGSIGLPSASPSGTPLITPMPSASGSAALTPSPSPSSSATASASPRPGGFRSEGPQIVYVTSDGTPVPMPAVKGLTAKLVDGHALYYAPAHNRYGMRTNAVAGEFVPQVSIEQADGSSAQTGGVVLAGPVVTQLIADRLASIEDQADRWTVALPVDIRGTTHAIDVSFDDFGFHGWSDTPRVVVKFSGQMKVTEIIPNNAGFHVLVESLGLTTWQAIDPERLNLPETRLDPDHLMNELVVYGTGTTNLIADIMANHPIPVGRTMLLATDEVSVSLVVRDSRANLGPDRILTVGDVPVFAAAS